jgi:TPR repeat protein
MGGADQGERRGGGVTAVIPVRSYQNGATMRDGWRREVIELKIAKRYEEALELIRQAIKEGDMAAHVMLAKMGDKAGLSRSEVDRLIEYVEANMDPDDMEAHWELYGAYDLRLGDIPYEQRAARCFYHHVRAAELGAGPIVSLAVARIYRAGALEVEPNASKSIRWYKRAIEQGSVEAVPELQKYYKQQERAAPKPQATVLPLKGRRNPRSGS